MKNYKELYLKMFRATEQAANTLLAAQQECEELYLSGIDANSQPISLQIPKGEDKR